MSDALNLPLGLSFPDLYSRHGLVALDAAFVASLEAEMQEALLAAREAPEALEPKAESELLLQLAPMLESFLAQLFGIEAEMEALVGQHRLLEPLSRVKRLFVQRRAQRAYKPDEAMGFDGLALEAQLAGDFGETFGELAFARHVGRWMEAEAEHGEALERAIRYAAWALHSPAGQARAKAGVLFKVPAKIDFERLVDTVAAARDGFDLRGSPHVRPRTGFGLTDAGADLTLALDQAHYCIFCHNQGKDSCSKGLREKDGAYKQSPTAVTLAGCPLEEKISEMNSLKSQGVPLGALAVAIVDNPMIAGTGHRICNDCMKSCIYQKQEPVNIPQVETRTLKDVLGLPWGFEIYSLLTRWNPLNLRRPLPLAESGYRVLVAGLGPAGYTLAHHLMNDGHQVVAVDGLKIEPLEPSLSGITPTGERVPFAPIRDVKQLLEPLDERIMGGFGGVAEYGITVRWDKNFLTILRLLLERREAFRMYGGVRFGSTLTVEDAWALGFDHVALCLGAGRPTLLDIPGGVAKGVRAASDFLMALQLTGAAKESSIANLHLRLPVVVIGGGLTGVDTTTEALAYYPVQVEKFLRRYEALVREKGESAVRAAWDEEERLVAEEWIAHARALRAAPDAAARLALLQGWGGATLAYRKGLGDAPAVRLNHEEVALALEEGIWVGEHLTPTAIDVDRFGHAEAIHLRRADGTVHRLPARSILVAAGTQPNTVLAREDAAHFSLDGKYFQALGLDGAPVTPERLAKPAEAHVLTRREADGRAVSFFGDLHPSFAGNVVKAMGSAKQGYPLVSRMLRQRAAVALPDFSARLNRELVATVHAVHRLTPTIVEVVVHAPMAARRFRPGQFYRLQNFERLAPMSEVTRLAMEGLALTGASADPERGLLSTIVLEMGGSSDLCALLRPGEPVVLMGPTGEPTHIPAQSTAILAGGGLGNAVLFSIGKAMRAEGTRVVYFAGYKSNRDRFKLDDIEAAADVVVWCCDEAPDFAPRRAQDRVFHGNIVQAMLDYAATPQPIALSDAMHMIVIGSDRMMAAVAAARHGALKPHLNPAHLAVGSINSPMQCMMKEICAQCLQQHVDPVSGAVSYVFSCMNQDQPLDCVSFPHLRARLEQNTLQEKLTAQWVDRALKQMGMRAAA